MLPETFLFTTSPDQRQAMRRILASNPVVRNLFPATDTTEQAKIDNFANVLQESVAREREEKMRRWNFDFENETPLPGVYDWFKSDGPNDWIAVEKTSVENDHDEDDEEKASLRLKSQNESTPKSNVDSELAIQVRKRRNIQDNSVPKDSGTRRKISFD